MQFLASSRVGPTRTKTPEGYLVCHDVRLANTRDMLYSGAQVRSWGWTDNVTGEPIEAGANDLINLSRTEDMLFSPEVMASFNGKPVTRDHPPVMLNPSEVRHYAIGTTTNVRKGEGENAGHLVGDLIIMDKDTIAAVESGLRGVSPGYDATVRQVAKGVVVQDHMVGNHVAIVPEGRGGRTCQIGDEVMTTAADAETTAKAGMWDKLSEMFAPKATPTPLVLASPAAPTFDSAAFKAELLGEVKGIVTEAVAALKPKEPAAATMDAAEAVTADAKITAMLPDLEVLKPGIAKPAATMDAALGAQREALTEAAAKHVEALKPLIAGRTVATMDAATLDTLVPAAAFMVRTSNDAANRQGLMEGLAKTVMAPVKDADDINAKAKAHFGAAMGFVS